MNTMRVILTILIISFCFAGTSNAAPETECATIEYIEKLNNGSLERVAHIKGENAIVFMALDPSWSEPEFQYEGYRDEHFIAATKGMRKSLMAMGVDEIVVWKLPRPILGTAVPFVKGCAVEGAGGLDYLDKLLLMHEVYLLVTEHGLEDSSIRDGIKRLILASSYAPHLSDDMIDTMIGNIRIVVANIDAAKDKKQ